MENVARFIAACQTAKRRLSGFLDFEIVPDAKLVAIGLEDATARFDLSSRFHVASAGAADGWLGVGNDSDYNQAQCLIRFPDSAAVQKVTLRALGEEVDARRKDRYKAQPKLTLTAMSNAPKKLRARERIWVRDPPAHPH
jgi:hypothetical protein